MIKKSRDEYDQTKKGRLLIPIRTEQGSLRPGFYKIEDLPDYAFKNALVYQEEGESQGEGEGQPLQSDKNVPILANTSSTQPQPQ